MNTEIWQRVNDHIDDKNVVIGWYHSHPNLSAFFSSTDRYTQRNFFNNDYSVGLVIDPVRNEEKLFLGRDSEELNLSQIKKKNLIIE